MSKKQNIGFDIKANKTPGNDNSITVINSKIDVRPWARTSQDVVKWRNATKAAESRIPRRTLLYDLYADVIQDGHVIAVTGKRRDAVTTANWKFVDKEGVEVDAINEAIDSIGFEEILEEIVNARFWGYSMLEPTFFKNDNDSWEVEANLIPRLNMRPERGVVAFDSIGDEGINIREGIYASTVMEVGKPSDLGLLISAAMYAVLKRGGWGDYAQFVQTFGIPIIDATWDGFDEMQRQKLLEAIQSMGSAGVLVRPDGTSVEIKENKSNANGQLQQGFISMLNREISKALLGSTETTESSSSSGYAQSKTHEGQDERKHESDINYARRILNSRFTKILRAWGFDTNGGSFVVMGEKNELTPTDSWNIISGLMDKGLPISHDFLYENFGVPKPDKGETTINGDVEEKEEDLEPDKPKDQDKDKEKEEKVKEQKKDLKLYERLFNGLSNFFVKAPTQQKVIGAENLTMNCCGDHRIITLSDKDTFNNDALIRRFYDAGGSAFFDAELFIYTAQILTTAFKKGWDRQPVELMDIGITYNANDPALMNAFEQNLFRFSAAKTLAEAQELNRLFRESTSFEQFYQNASLKLKVYNKTWLETEYTTALLTGQSASTYNRLMGRVDVFPYWEYRTMEDEAVRPQHQLLNGIILPANDPRWDKIMPPNGWLCRCWIVPRTKKEVEGVDFNAMRKRIDEYYESEEFFKNDAQGWGVNRAKTAEVFSANQQYINTFKGKASKLLNSLGASDYNLPSYSNLKNKPSGSIPTSKVKADEFYEKLEVLDGKRIARDYNNRPIEFDKKSYDEHTTGKKESRVEYLGAMDEALKKPDEVWINGDDLDQINYIKYYDDGAVVVASNIIKNKFNRIKTWFPLKELKNVIERYRKGLLIKK